MNEMNPIHRRYDDEYDDRYYDDRRRNYDRRDRRYNNRYYRNYREQDYYEELEMCMEDMREKYRELEDIAEMAENSQEKNAIMKVAQQEKENYMYLKQLLEK